MDVSIVVLESIKLAKGLLVNPHACYAGQENIRLVLEWAMRQNVYHVTLAHFKRVLAKATVAFAALESISQGLLLRQPISAKIAWKECSHPRPARWHALAASRASTLW